MFWIFTTFAGLMAFAVALGKISVWLTLFKFALLLAVGLIVVMAIALLMRRPRQKKDQ